MGSATSTPREQAEALTDLTIVGREYDPMVVGGRTFESLVGKAH